MKVPFQQTTKSGCGSYSLANLFNNNVFINDVDKLEVGETTARLNEKIKSLGDIYCWLETLFCTQTHLTKHPTRLLDSTLFDIHWEKVSGYEKEAFAKPYFATIKRTDTINHCILFLQVYKTNQLHVVDSLEEQIKIFTIDEFINEYYILEVLHFGLVKEKPNECMVIIKNAFPHLFEKEI